MYEQYLQALLEPLGVYNFEAGGIQRAELAALGAELDHISNRLEQAEREGNTATAVDQGLSRREALFLHRPAAATAEDRRAAIAALLQIDGDSLTPSAINLTLRGCGIKAWAQEKGNGCLRVLFPEVAGIPEGFERIRTIILEILPCHLAVEFYFRYLTWDECERAAFTWESVEADAHTWNSFQLAVPPMT
jgi:hypothetical protein